MIPKTIHYCWFGHNPLPELARKCIDSWRKYLPDYEIVEWNEYNFDVNSIPYTAQAYEASKYAFVSDYARFKILYEHGGIYFDTDVEVIKPLEEIIANGPFMGFEKNLHSQNGDKANGVNPGLGLAAEPNMKIYGEILEFYKNKNFNIKDGNVVTYTTSILLSKGLEEKNVEQKVAGITIYPTDVFCPMDSTTGITTLTDDTVSIHHYSCSWIDHNTVGYRLHLLKNWLIKIFGRKIIMNICGFFKK